MLQSLFMDVFNVCISVVGMVQSLPTYVFLMLHPCSWHVAVYNVLCCDFDLRVLRCWMLHATRVATWP
jgi:hypothetical protein